MNRLLWIVQVALALLYLFMGGMKLVLSAEQMSAGIALPVWFVRFIGVCEILGALGLILPGILKVRPGLTPLAAAGLVVIMIGATVTTVVTFGPAMAVIPLVAGLLAASVAYGRWRLAPLGPRRPARKSASQLTTAHR